MANAGLVDLEKELTCSICTELLYQPLTLLDCLHTFCGFCLKEWFSWQESHPTERSGNQQFTCPSCRALVRDTRHDAKVATLLDLFLRSHPEKDKRAAEKEEIAQKYKPGDEILPVRGLVESPVNNEEEEEDRRLLEEVRALSLREMEGRGRHRDNRDSPPRGERSGASEHTSAHQRIEDARRRRRPMRQMNSSPRSFSPLDRNASRMRNVEHQSSLRSLLSNPDFSETAIQEEILRQITEEGLLDGIDLQSLDPDQEEELTERIAEAFRTRQRQRAASNSERERSHETQPILGPPSTSASHPTAEWNRYSEANVRQSSGSSLPVPQGHRRTASGQSAGRRHTSPGSRPPKERVRSAHASTVDVSSSQWLNSDARSQTESHGNITPTSDHKRDASARRRRRSSRSDHRDVSSREPSSSSHREPSTSHASQPSHLLHPRLEHTSRNRSTSRSSTGNPPGRLTIPRSRHSPPRQEHYTEVVSATFVEPSVTCERCGKQNLEYELHKLCTVCKGGKYHLCFTCYRQDLGCLHWFGFGDAAQIRFEKSQNVLPREQRTEEPPHRLQSHRYLRPARESVLAHTTEDGSRLTTSNPENRLQDGLFCDMCGSFADSCFWKCGECNDGEWGFCTPCVNQGKCCSHLLLPIARMGNRTGQTQPSSGVDPSAGLTLSGNPEPTIIVDNRLYRSLTVVTNCRICTYPIPNHLSRYHCPTCNDGDYDICSTCYLKLCATAKISKENGRNGWRRCPQYHRMIITGYEDHDDGQRRVIIKGLVGGYAMKDDLDPASPGSANRTISFPNSPLSRQDSDPWEWPEGAGPNTVDSTGFSKGTRRKLNRTRHHLSSGTPDSSKNPIAPRFPPSGGIGLRLVALWSYYPEPDETDEIMFPRGAEITEAENINDDWLWGCYAGQKGLFPGHYAKVVEEVGMLN